jgi:hypothetical protein
MDEAASSGFVQIMDVTQSAVKAGIHSGLNDPA